MFHNQMNMPLQGAAIRSNPTTTTNSGTHQMMHVRVASETGFAEKEYFDEIYLMKQKAARRKLAYDYNLVGRKQNINKKQSALGTKNWSNAKAVGKTRSRLAMSVGGNVNLSYSHAVDSSQQNHLTYA